MRAVRQLPHTHTHTHNTFPLLLHTLHAELDGAGLNRVGLRSPLQHQVVARAHRLAHRPDLRADSEKTTRRRLAHQLAHDARVVRRLARLEVQRLDIFTLTRSDADVGGAVAPPVTVAEVRDVEVAACAGERAVLRLEGEEAVAAELVVVERVGVVEAELARRRQLTVEDNGAAWGEKEEERVGG